MPNLRQLRVRKTSRPFLNKTSDDVIVNTNDSAPLYKADTTHAGISPDCITIPDRTYEGGSQVIDTIQVKKSLSRCRTKNGSKEAKVLDQSSRMSKVPVLSDMLLKSTNKSAHLQKLKEKTVKVTDPKKRKSETLITTRSKQPRLDVMKVGTTQSNTSCSPVDKTNLKEPFVNKNRNMTKEKEKKSRLLHEKADIPKTGPSNYLIPEKTQASILRPQHSGSVTIKMSSESHSTSLVTVDSSSDSDFEVHTSYRTHNVTCTTEICESVSDRGINKKLADSFTDFDDTQHHPNSTMIPDSGKVKQCYGHKTNMTKSDKESTSSKQTSKKPVIKKKGKRQGTEVAVKEKNSLGKKENHKHFQTMTVKTDGDMPIHSDMDVMSLLMKMEGRVKSDANGAPTTFTSISKNNISAIDDAHHSESEEDSDWEEVEDLKHSPMKSQIPIGPVEIIIDDPSLLHRKRRKKEFDWRAYIQRRINRLAREIQVDMHKVHLLCLLSLGKLQNQIFNDTTLGAVTLSHIPAEHFKKSIAKQDSQSLLSIVRWFQEEFSLSSTPTLQNLSLVRADKLFEVLEKKTSDEWRHLIMILVILLRAMGFRVRFVMSLQVLPLKMSQTSARKSVPKKSNKISEHGVEDGLSTKDANTKSTKKASTAAVTSLKQKAPKPVRKKTKLVQSSKQSTEPTKKNVIVTKKNQQSKKPKLSDPVLSSSGGGDDVKDDDDDYHLPVKRRSSRRKLALKTSLFPDDDLEGELRLTSCSDEGSNFSDDSLVKSERNKGRRFLPHKCGQEQDKNENSEDEFEQSVSVCRPLRKNKKPKPKNKKILSSSSSDTSLNESWRNTKAGQDCWLEVLLESNQRWICVDYTKCLLGKPYEIAAAASQPLLYVLSFDNNGCIKDVTPKYAVNWMSHTRKQRVDTSWWNHTLKPYASQNIKLDDLENEEIRVQLMQRPLPTSVSEFKNHPLYALSRHLLKFEAIYPETSIPVGFFRQEPVYARESVHVLHSRDNWLKEGRTVRIGESAYKKVKSRKRWKRPQDNTDELDLELFGHWQTEEYIPPPAVNGKVPKNEYGNIELFQPSMLPAGTVHLRVPALNRVAKKLNIDIAAAMVGWDHHCGYSHPVLDGWVVCKEHEDVLMTAWQQDQEIQRQREAEKRKKRVLNNWTALTRGLLIKEKLKKKFNLEEKKTSKKKIAQKMDGEVATDLQHSWPAKQQQKKGKQKKMESQPAHYTVETM